MNQDEAFNLLKMGGNTFLTGEAGSGKTYLLNKYIKYLKEHHVGVAVTASTGIAATHLHGTTIHSWSGIGIKDRLTDQDLARLREAKQIKRNYKTAKVVIIDEISMLHPYQLDMVDLIARTMLSPDKAFGGIQIVLCGDFFQLPPVSSASSRQEKQFAFESAAWKNGAFQICYLHEQHRQVNDPLHTVLKDIRSGTAGEHTKVPLRTRYKKEPQGTTKATKLYSRNMNVDIINDRELINLPGQEKTFTMATQGFVALVDGLKKSCLAVEQLKLKIGAEVMFIKNDMLGRYSNGTRSVVVGFEKEGGFPIVKTYDNEIIVAYPEEWKYEDNGTVRATITQVPLRLAWAMTVHKSQGMTLDAAEIDLGDAFEPGMGYVALSRVRSLTGLKLMNLNEMALKVHPKILQQDTLFKEYSTERVAYLQTLSEQEITLCHEKTLIERFEGARVKANEPRKAKPKLPKREQTPTHMKTLAFLKENMLPEAIAETRGLDIGTILQHLEKLKGLNLLEPTYLDQLKMTISEDEFALILSAFKKSEDGRLRPIYDQFDGKYTYNRLQLVRLFVMETMAECNV